MSHTHLHSEQILRQAVIAARSAERPVKLQPLIVALPPSDHVEAASELAIAVPWMDERPEPVITIEMIKRAVAADFNVTKMDIESPRRTRNVMVPRMVTYYLAKIMTLRSFPEIGRRIGMRDHTTALSGFRKMEKMIAADPELAARVETIRTTLARNLT